MRLLQKLVSGYVVTGAKGDDDESVEGKGKGRDTRECREREREGERALARCVRIASEWRLNE